MTVCTLANTDRINYVFVRSDPKALHLRCQCSTFQMAVKEDRHPRTDSGYHPKCRARLRYVLLEKNTVFHTMGSSRQVTISGKGWPITRFLVCCSPASILFYPFAHRYKALTIFFTNCTAYLQKCYKCILWNDV